MTNAMQSDLTTPKARDVIPAPSGKLYITEWFRRGRWPRFALFGALLVREPFAWQIKIVLTALKDCHLVETDLGHHDHNPEGQMERVKGIEPS
jgi:hypothetical protein